MKQKLVALTLLLLVGQCAVAQDIEHYADGFAKGYRALDIPALTLSYRDYFEHIPDIAALNKQEAFFIQAAKQLKNYQHLKGKALLYYQHLKYETAYNLERIALEKEWVQQGRKIPVNGLYTMANRKEWYSFFIKRFTSMDLTPEEVYKLGIAETKRVQKEIADIQKKSGFETEAAFYAYLQSDDFYLHDQQKILDKYEVIDRTVRAHLPAFVNVGELPGIWPMEWPDADAYTPPGMYLSSADNAYGKDVFQFNFYGQKHNTRSMEWLYMHEGIPGHHLQSTFRRNYVTAKDFQTLFYYPGNFEGWACYVEYYGKDLGLYQDIYEELGKWEWDLVRSVRLVLDVGVHYYGWDRAKAMAFWKEQIRGQDAIADREITRITNWPCQALSYKVGASTIEHIKQRMLYKNPELQLTDFHKAYLELSYFPLQVIDQYFN